MGICAKCNGTLSMHFDGGESEGHKFVSPAGLVKEQARPIHTAFPSPKAEAIVDALNEAQGLN